jgi:hypothetical protein
MRDLIRKILREERNVDYTRLIQKLIDRTIVSQYPDDICRVEVEGYTENVQYPRYWVSVIFKVSENILSNNVLVRSIMDDIYTTVNNYFDVPPRMRSAFTRDCEEATEDLFEGEITERCWKGYTQKGMKTMFGKRYPNCVKKKK